MELNNAQQNRQVDRRKDEEGLLEAVVFDAAICAHNACQWELAKALSHAEICGSQ